MVSDALPPELQPLQLTLLIAGLALLPSLLLGMTSFLKLSIVLAFLRNALGAGQIPSAPVSSFLALVLSAYIMAPVAQQSWQNYQRAGNDSRIKNSNGGFVSHFQGELFESTAEPWQQFLEGHSGQREIALFKAHLSERLTTERLTAERETGGAPLEAQQEVKFGVLGSFAYLVPAFVMTELREAFYIGFSIFLPFLVVDLVVANVLVGLGMVMVSPAMISLPIKILLFVSADGWLLLSESLLLGYSIVQ